MKVAKHHCLLSVSSYNQASYMEKVSWPCCTNPLLSLPLSSTKIMRLKYLEVEQNCRDCQEKDRTSPSTAFGSHPLDFLLNLLLYSSTLMTAGPKLSYVYICKPYMIHTVIDCQHNHLNFNCNHPLLSSHIKMLAVQSKTF